MLASRRRCGRPRCLADRLDAPRNLLTSTAEGLGVTRHGGLVFGTGGGVVRITPGATDPVYELLPADAEPEKERAASDAWVLALVGGFVLLLGVIAYLALRHGV